MNHYHTETTRDIGRDGITRVENLPCHLHNECMLITLFIQSFNYTGLINLSSQVERVTVYHNHIRNKG